MKKNLFLRCFWGLALLVVVGLNVGIFGYLLKGDSCSNQSQLSRRSYTSPMQPNLPQDEETIALRMINFLMELAAKR